MQLCSFLQLTRTIKPLRSVRVHTCYGGPDESGRCALCSVLPHPVLTSQRLFVSSSVDLCLQKKQNKTVCLPREPNAKLNFSCRESRGWVSRLILSSSALYHTVLMLISLFLHANMLFCLSKLNKKLQYKEILFLFLFRWCSLFIQVVLVSSSQVNTSDLSDLLDYTF